MTTLCNHVIPLQSGPGNHNRSINRSSWGRCDLLMESNRNVTTHSPMSPHCNPGSVLPRSFLHTTQRTVAAMHFHSNQHNDCGVWTASRHLLPCALCDLELLCRHQMWYGPLFLRCVQYFHNKFIFVGPSAVNTAPLHQILFLKRSTLKPVPGSSSPRLSSGSMEMDEGITWEGFRQRQKLRSSY